MHIAICRYRIACLARQMFGSLAGRSRSSQQPPGSLLCNAPFHGDALLHLSDSHHTWGCFQSRCTPCHDHTDYSRRWASRLIITVHRDPKSVHAIVSNHWAVPAYLVFVVSSVLVRISNDWSTFCLLLYLPYFAIGGKASRLCLLWGRGMKWWPDRRLRPE